MIEEVYQPEQEQEQELTLKEYAEKIRDEKETGENTAERVGGLLVAMVEKDEETAEAVETLKGEQENTAKKVEKLGESLSTLQGKQESTERNVRTLQDQQKTTSQEVSDLRNKQQETAASVETLQTQQKTTAQEVSTLKEQQGITAADVAELKGDVSGLQSEQTQQGQSIDTLKQQQQMTAEGMSMLYEQQNATTQEVSTLKGQQQTTASDVISLQAQQKDTAGKVDALQEKQTDTDTAVKTLRTDVDTLQGQQKTTDASVKALGESLDEHKKSAEETYAKKDGTYEDLTAGNAVNLQGTTEMTNSSAYRTTGGNEDVLFGTAQVLSVQGNSVAWNQILNPEHLKPFADGYINKCSITTNHIYLSVCNVDTTKLQTQIRIMFFDATNNPYSDKTIDVPVKGKNTVIKNIMQVKEKIEINNIYIKSYPKTSEEDITVNSWQLFDLTLIYGAGKEPNTPEQFEADYQRWFGKPLTYEEYDEGSIRTTLASGIKTVGFNLYSGENLKGTVRDLLKINEGLLFYNDISYTGQIHISFDVSIDSDVPGNSTFIRVRYTDDSNTYIGFNNINGNHANVLTEKGKVVKQISLTSGGYTNEILTFSNICINFSWSGKRDGEYEPYWSETQPLPLTTLKGKLNGDGESVVVFPDGMKRAGTIYDEIKIENGVTKAIKRVGSVDLGTLSWTKSNNASCFYSRSINNILDNVLCAKYKNVVKNLTWSAAEDKGIFADSGQHAIIINDSSFTELSTFLSAINGVVVYYELLEPQEYIIDDFELPLVYRIDDFGTEQILQPENSIAPTIITKYGINAVDAIRRMPKNYISSISIDNFLAKLSEVMGGTWSKSWNESRGGYDFNFVPSEEAADGGGEIPAQ